MPLVTVKTKYQVTLPTSVRKQAGVAVGDLLEAKVEGQKITLTPKSIIDRELAHALEDVRKGRVYGLTLRLCYHPRLSEQLAAAPLPIRKAFDRKLHLLVRDLHHPSLRAKKYDEAKDIWQARVTRGMCYELLRVVAHRRMFRRPLTAGEAWSFVDRGAAEKVLDEVRRVVQGAVVAGSLSEGQRDGAGCRLWEAGRLLEQRDVLPSALLSSILGPRLA